MARCLTAVLFLLALIAVGRSQFFADFFQGFQPFVTTRPTLRQIYEQSTKRTTVSTRNNFKTTKNEQTTKSYGSDRSNAFSSQYSSIERDENRRRKSTSSNYYTTTVKPRKINSSRRIINNGIKDQSTQVDNNNKINSIGDYYTQKPNYGNRATENYKPNNYYTTSNPFYNRPGVRPAVVDDRPPITNRPVTRRPNYGVNPRPKDEDAIAFPDEGDVSPEVIIGPDEEYMSAVEKKRYIELSERMCDKYKSIGTKAVQAIPLLPSPEPVRVNVSGCAPTNVPLVVGGTVVRIKEFPHMALLGWRKLQGPGYSWKCGGSLVSEQFVLTAAHCSYQDRDNTVVNGPPRAVQLGSSYLDDPGALVVKVASVIRHPKYKLPRSYYDLALVKLINAVKFSEVIKPACLGVPPAVGQSIIATGWGRTEDGGDQSHELRSVSLPIWDMYRCQDVLGTSRKLPDGPSPDSQICAGEMRGGKDTCQGDSGGPAQLQEGCAWRVVAVTSLGRSCGAAETPGLYAIVHRAFVASQIFGAQNKYNNANSGSNNQNYGNNNDQNYNNNQNNNRQDSYRPQGTNSGSNNANSAVNHQDYGNNNGQNDNNQNNNRQDSYRPQGTNSGSNNANSAVNNQDYGNSNDQNYNNRQDSYNKPQGTITRPSNNDRNNYEGQNGYKRPQENSNTQPVPNNDYNNGQYNRNRPNGNVNYNPQDTSSNNDQKYGTEFSNVNYGNNNRQQNDYNNNQYNQGYTTKRPNFENNNHSTKRPIRDDNSGIIFSDDYNRQNSQIEYTTKKPIRNNNGFISEVNSDYANNNNNRDQSSYNRNNNQPNQRVQINYENIRPTNNQNYSINRPWWLTY